MPVRSRRRFMELLALTGAGCAVRGGGGGWPGAEWERIDPLARAHGGRGWAAWESGRRVAGWNDRYGGPVLSITKALAALAAARADAEGWLDAGESVADTVPEWRADPRKRRITVAMLLQQTAGLASGVAALYRDPADKGSRAVALRCIDEPGTFFRYGPACWEVLAELMQRKLSRRGRLLEDFLDRAVMRPLGLASPEWRSDRRGRFFLSTGAELRVAELGRLGGAIAKLLQGGEAGGIPADAFARMTRSSAANPLFGGGLWRNSGGREIEVESALDPAPAASFWRDACLSRQQPRDLVALIGSSGRRVFIWPSSGRVIARHGVSAAWRDRPFLAALPTA
jgi:CubicO group peptidase (beta-lactamase class C family)